MTALEPATLFLIPIAHGAPLSWSCNRNHIPPGRLFQFFHRHHINQGMLEEDAFVCLESSRRTSEESFRIGPRGRRSQHLVSRSGNLGNPSLLLTNAVYLWAPLMKSAHKSRVIQRGGFGNLVI